MLSICPFKHPIILFFNGSQILIAKLSLAPLEVATKNFEG